MHFMTSECGMSISAKFTGHSLELPQNIFGLISQKAIVFKVMADKL